MKILVVYYSETGNTAKIAGAIHKVASYRGHTVCLKPIGDVTVDALSTYDLVFLGSACHDADLARPVMQLLEQIPASPGFKLAGFVTHASYTPEGGDREGKLHERWAAKCAFSFGKACQKKGIDLLGYYGCMGAPSPPIEQFIHNTIVTEAEEWERYLEEVRRHPDEADLQQAGEFAGQVLARCEA
jgi:flavodoxin